MRVIHALKLFLPTPGLKEASADPVTLAWILDELRIGPDAPLPGGLDAAELDAFRQEFVRYLRSEAFAVAMHGKQREET